MNTQKTELLQDIPSLFDASWEAYKRAFFRLLKVNWLPVLIGGVVAAVFSYISATFETGEAFEPINVIRMIGIMFGMAVISLVISSLAYIAQIKVLEKYHEKAADEDAVANESEESVLIVYKKSAPLFVSYVWVTLLTTLAITGGLIALFVPGVVFAIWFSFAPLIFIVEGDKGSKALKKSKAYIRGIWSPVFYRYLALIAFMILIGVAGGVFKGFLKKAFNLDLEGDFFLNFVYQLLVAPYFLIFIYELYKDVVRVNREIESGDAEAAEISNEVVEKAGESVGA